MTNSGCSASKNSHSCSVEALLDRLVPPHVARVVPLDVLAGAPHDEHLAHVGAALHRLVHHRLQTRRRPAPVPAVGGDDDVRLAVDDAVRQRGRGEPAEHHRVRGAEPRTRQHGDHRLRDHRHVDRDAIAGLHAELDEGVRRLADHVLEVGVGDGAGVVGRLALPAQRDLVAVAVLDVPVDAVVGHVQPAADEPLRERGVGPVEHLVPLLRPGQPFGRLGPEAQPVLRRPVVGVGLDVRLFGELRRGREAAFFVRQVGEGFAHVTNLVFASGAVNPLISGGTRAGRCA